MESNPYKLDRSAFKMLTFEEAATEMQDSKSLSQEERFRQFNYLMSVAFRFMNKPWPRMDRNHFEMIKR